MVKVISFKCPDCSANLSVDGELKQCFCQYCGAKILIDDGSTIHKYHKIDEARIKEAEVKELIRLKELEIEEKTRIDKEKNKANKIKLSIILGLVSAILIFVGFAAGEASSNPDSSFYILSMIGMFGLFGIFFAWMQ